MSSPIEERTDWVAWGALALCLTATILYAQQQFVLSLLFFYQLVQYVLLS